MQVSAKTIPIAVDFPVIMNTCMHSSVEASFDNNLREIKELVLNNFRTTFPFLTEFTTKNIAIKYEGVTVEKTAQLKILHQLNPNLSLKADFGHYSVAKKDY